MHGVSEISLYILYFTVRLAVLYIWYEVQYEPT
jgi:hypothetical protein